MSFIVPTPPNPDDLAFRQNPLAYNRALYRWMSTTKGALEQSRVLAVGVPVSAPRHGDIAIRGSAAWERLAAGSSGQFLQTRGVGTNPAWAGAGGGFSAGTGIAITTGSATSSIALASIANNTGLVNTAGSAAPPSATGLSAWIDSAIGGTHGDILYRGTAAWSRLAAGTSGDLLMTQGTGANPAWATRPRFKVGDISHDISLTGTQVVTGIGFKPKHVSLLANINGEAKSSHGFSDGTTHRSMFTQNGTTWSQGANAIALWTDGTTFATANVNSLDSDGFSLVWAKTGSPTGTAVVSLSATG